MTAHQKVARAGVLLAACVAAGASLYATSQGPGLGPDSLKYVLLAHSLDTGQGFALAGQPMTHFPPGYPALLWLVGCLGPGSLARASLLHAALFAANLLLAARLARTAAGGAVWAAPVTALLLLAAPALTTVHSMLWSEVPFVSLMLLALWWLGRHGAGGPDWMLVAGAACLGAASLTRYVGLAFLPLALVAPLLRRPFHWGRWRPALAAVLIAGGPSLCWLLRNTIVAGDLADRALAYHPLGVGHLTQVLEASRSFAGPAGALGFGLTIAAFLWGSLAQFRSPRDPEAASVRCLAALAGACYAAFLAASLAFADADTPLDVRMLSPLFMLGVILVAAVPGATTVRPRLGAIAWGILALLGLGNLGRTFSEAEELAAGPGFSHPYWRHSATLEYARRLAPGTKLYSNGPEIVAFFGGHDTLDIPLQASRTSLQADPKYPVHLRDFCFDIRQPGTVFVHLDGVSWRWEAPTPGAIESACHVSPAVRFEDGAVYGGAASATVPSGTPSVSWVSSASPRR